MATLTRLRGAMQQARAEPILQRLDVLAGGCLGNAEFACRTGETPDRGNLGENRHARQSIHVHHTNGSERPSRLSNNSIVTLIWCERNQFQSALGFASMRPGIGVVSGVSKNIASQSRQDRPSRLLIGRSGAHIIPYATSKICLLFTLRDANQDSSNTTAKYRLQAVLSWPLPSNNKPTNSYVKQQGHWLC